jgi:cystathionine beta-lyase/cystathionine gamma-synthase
VVVHSTSKYLSGHSDVIGGFVATDDAGLAAALRLTQKAAGAVPGPFDCFLVLRGLRTLELRMARHSVNAQRVAEALGARDDVALVRYPGLASGRHAHPQAELAARQMRLPGGMIAFLPAERQGRAPEERARRIAEGTAIFTLAESLGGVESLIELPAAMTHGSVAGSSLEIPAALVRLSVGIEDADDLIADLLGALDRA